MSTTEPIREKDTLHEFKNYYLERRPNLRNYALIVVGLNTALRITDLLHLKWEDIYTNGEMRTHLYVTEQKTNKINRIYLNKEATTALKMMIPHRALKNPYVFTSSASPDNPLSRQQAYRIIRRAAQSVGLSEHVSCHSLRKTFGYHAWKQGTQPALLMSIYNHSSYEITTRYLCIEQDDKEEVYCKIQL